MKMLLLLAAVAVGLTAAGVIHFQKNGDKVDISFDESRFRQETAKIVHEGEQALGNAEQGLQNNQQQNPNQIEQAVESEIRTQARRLLPTQQ